MHKYTRDRNVFFRLCTTRARCAANRLFFFYDRAASSYVCACACVWPTRGTGAAAVVELWNAANLCVQSRVCSLHHLYIRIEIGVGC